MRAVTRSVMQAPAGFWAFSYLEVTNYDGTWINVAALAIGSRSLNFFNTLTWSDDIDRNTLSVSATLTSEIGAFSLVPFRSDSPVNVDDSSTYQPLLDLHREWRLMGVFVPRGTYPDPGDYREIVSGWVDRLDIQGDPAEITLQGRGPEADLIDRRIAFVDATADPLVPITSDTPKTYAGGTQADVIQAILDEELGAGVVTLTVDASAPAEYVNGWEQTTDVGLFDLLTQIASLGGGSLRYRYDASDVLTLTLFAVDRNPSNPDWQIDADEYEKLDAGIDISGIRNFVFVRYQDTNFGIQAVSSPVAPPYPPTSASIARYGLRPLPIDLSAQTQVTDQTAAGNLADAVRSDLEFPVVEQQVQGTGLWFAGLGDYVKLVANGVHYNEDQFGGVTTYSHTFANGELVSTIGLRGKPAGRYRTWLDFGTGAPRVPFTPTLTSLDATFSEVVFLFSIPQIQWTAVAGQYTNSVFVEYSDDPTFATTITTSNHAATPGESVTGGTLLATTADRDATYYVRATPYSGPIVSSVVSGTAGAQYQANTYAPPKLVDSSTITVNTSTPGAISYDVVPSSGGGAVAGDDEPYTTWDDPTGLTNARKWVARPSAAIDLSVAGEIGIDLSTLVSTIVTGLGSAANLGSLVVFVNIEDDDTAAFGMALGSIPTSEVEIGADLRRQFLASGAISARVIANVKTITGTPTLKAKYTTDNFGAVADLCSLAPAGTGLRVGAWTTIPAGARADIGLTSYIADGAGTASMTLYYLAVEFGPVTVSGAREHSDEHAPEFS